MREDNHLASIRKIQRSLEQVNYVVQGRGKLHPVFRLRSIPSIEFSCYEAGFLRVVSWLYILLYEAGRADLKFLLEKMRGFGLDVDETHKVYFRLIHSLRTKLQHSVNFEDFRNDPVKQMTELWFA